MIKVFTPPRICLLAPASNGLGLSIMLKSVKRCVYNAQMLLKPTPMSLECPKIAIEPPFASNLVKK